MASFDFNRSWVILSSIEESIRAKIEAIGVPLKNWDINIFRGVLTGYNEAFIIDDLTREQLIKSSPNSAEIIRPILLGRNIKRYSYEWENLWLINSHNGIKGKNIPRVNIERDHPVVFRHLSKFKEQLEKRLDQGDHWTNLRNCAYIEDFDKPKIAWGNLALTAQFSFIPSGFIINAPSPFFSSDNYYLLAILNSKIGDYYIQLLGVSRSGGYFEYKPMFVEQLPIPKINDSDQEPFKKIIREIFSEKEKAIDTTRKEEILDEMVFDLYNINEVERRIIKGEHL